MIVITYVDNDRGCGLCSCWPTCGLYIICYVADLYVRQSCSCFVHILVFLLIIPEEHISIRWDENEMFSQYKIHPSLWPSGIGSRLGRSRLWVRFLAVSDIYPMFIEPTITWVISGFSGYIWLDTKMVLKYADCPPSMDLGHKSNPILACMV